MTLIRRTVKRETFGTVFDRGKRRAVIVTIEQPSLLGFRLKGTRKTYYLTAEAMYWKAVQCHVADEKRRKADERKAKKAGKVDR